jgi:hypothetical protein
MVLFHVKKTGMAEELQRAAKICAHSKQAVVEMFQEVRMGKAIYQPGAPEISG